MNYTKPSFSVNPSGAKPPAECKHGWLDARHRCVLCGTPIFQSDKGFQESSRRIIGRSHVTIDGLAKR